MRLRLPVLALVAVAAAAGPALGETSRFHRYVRTAGSTRAELVYAGGGRSRAQQPRVRILRGGRQLLAERIPAPAQARRYDYPVVPTFGPDWFTLRDLDGDGEPEVYAEVWWYGMYCCVWSRTYRFDGSTFVATTHWWGDLDAKPRLRDVDGDGRLEFLSVDDRFAALAAHVSVFFPVQIWAYDHGAFRDVTRRFPDLVARDAARIWRYHVRYRGKRSTRYALAAWAADESMLGRTHSADSALDRALRRGDLAPRLQDTDPLDPQAYARFLKRFLRRNGY